MHPAVLEAVAAVALAVLLAVAYRHPRSWVEATLGLGAAILVLSVGAVGPRPARAEVTHLLPVVLFLCAILLVSDLCAAEGLFAAVGGVVTRLGGGDPVRMLGLTFLAAVVTTTVLSLDATVVLLTPVAAAAATASLVNPRPLVHACARLANSASLLLPVSNLTNLLALPDLHLSFLGFAARMAPVWLVVITAEYVGHRFLFRHELSGHGRGAPVGPPVAMPVFPLVVVAIMLVAFATLSPLGVVPAWVAGAAALVLATRALLTRRVDVRRVAQATRPSFAIFVLGLGVVVAALSRTFLGDTVRDLVPHDGSLLALLGIAVLATVLANLVNNLPATLLVMPVLAPLGVSAVLAGLIGLNVGSGLTWTGSLANLLWRRTLAQNGMPATSRAFHSVSVVLTPPILVLAVLTLWGWDKLLAIHW